MVIHCDVGDWKNLCKFKRSFQISIYLEKITIINYKYIYFIKPYIYIIIKNINIYIAFVTKIPQTITERRTCGDYKKKNYNKYILS